MFVGDDRVTFPLWGGDGSEANGVSDGVGTGGNHVTPSHPLLMGRTVGEPTQGTHYRMSKKTCPIFFSRILTIQMDKTS